MGHIGLTPQSVHAMGGFKVQGREQEAAAAAGRTTPRRWPTPAASPSCSRACPTRWPAWSPTPSTSPPSASAPGRHCDGQVLVFHDVLGIEDRITPKFVRRYASLKADGVSRRSRPSPTTCAPGASRPTTRATTSVGRGRRGPGPLRRAASRPTTPDRAPEGGRSAPAHARSIGRARPGRVRAVVAVAAVVGRASPRQAISSAAASPPARDGGDQPAGGRRGPFATGRNRCRASATVTVARRRLPGGRTSDLLRACWLDTDRGSVAAA